MKTENPPSRSSSEVLEAESTLPDLEAVMRLEIDPDGGLMMVFMMNDG